MNTQSPRITKEDVELIALGLNEYVRTFGPDKNNDEEKDINFMLDRIKKYLNNFH